MDRGFEMAWTPLVIQRAKIFCTRGRGVFRGPGGVFVGHPLWTPPKDTPCDILQTYLIGIWIFKCFFLEFGGVFKVN